MLVKALYQWQIAGGTAEDLLSQFAERDDFARVDQTHFRSILEASLNRSGEFEKIIASYAKRGPEQLDTVGRAVLLSAIAEMSDCPDVPTNVVINEAVNLAKRYAAADSYKFVNAVLDKAAKEIRPASA